MSCASSTKVVKLNIKPVVGFLVLAIILSAYLLASQALLQRFRLGCRAVFVSAAQEKRV